MSSSLTSTNKNSGYLYFVLLGFITIAVYYFLALKNPNTVNNLNRHAFELNYAAFKNAIELAHFKFKVNQNKQIDNKQKTQNPFRNISNIWQDNQQELFYNYYGFPIGVDVINKRQIKPETAADCQAIWQFILGDLQPIIFTSKTAEQYWTTLNSNHACIYQSENVSGIQISYQSHTGSVNLLKISP